MVSIESIRDAGQFIHSESKIWSFLGGLSTGARFYKQNAVNGR